MQGALCAVAVVADVDVAACDDDYVALVAVEVLGTEDDAYAGVEVVVVVAAEFADGAAVVLVSLLLCPVVVLAPESSEVRLLAVADAAEASGEGGAVVLVTAIGEIHFLRRDESAVRFLLERP